MNGTGDVRVTAGKPPGAHPPLPVDSLAVIAERALSPAILLAATLAFLFQTYRHHIRRWDDAYITFRFAQHLADGQGLTWNVGAERVEGYTSLLAVLVLAFAQRLGAAPEAASLLINAGAVLATAGLMVVALQRQLGHLHPAAAAVVALYLVAEVTTIHATSGLETQLFVLMLASTYVTALVFVDRPNRRTAVVLSGTVFLAVLCRPEAVLYGAALYAVLGGFFFYRFRTTGLSQGVRESGLSAGLLLLFGLVYAAWKLSYFGYLLPNPFYVKSNHVTLAGAKDVARFIRYVVLWFGPVVLGCAALAVLARARVRGGIGPAVRLVGARTWVGVLLTFAPPAFALAYYSTIIHEVGGAYRFSYPTYFYLVFAMAVFASWVIRSVRLSGVQRVLVAFVCLIYALLPVRTQESWRLDTLPLGEFGTYHWRIAGALAATGLGAQATVLTDAAGVIPYVSGFNQVDRVGLTDNYLSGRRKLSLEDRERYIWSRQLDVYVGYEPPASDRVGRMEDEPKASSRYVRRVLLESDLVLVEDRILVQDPRLLHARMRELRDHWIWLGEVDWPGAQWKGLKAFLFVRRDSAHLEALTSSLSKIISRRPDAVDLDVVG